jgi:2TM domain
MPYTSEDVQNILKLAMARSQEDSFSQQQLEEMATELGINADVLKYAQQEWVVQNKISHQRQEILKRRKRGFMAHLIPYIAVNTFLIILNLVTTPKICWAIYPIAGWGLGLFFHGWAAYKMPVVKSKSSFLRTDFPSNCQAKN